MPIHLDNNSLHSILVFLRLRTRLALRTTNKSLRTQIDFLHLTSTALFPSIDLIDNSPNTTLTRISHFLHPRNLTPSSEATFAFSPADSAFPPAFPALCTSDFDQLPPEQFSSITQLQFTDDAPASRTAVNRIIKRAQATPLTRLESLTILPGLFFSFSTLDLLPLFASSRLRSVWIRVFVLEFTDIRKLIRALPFPEALESLTIESSIDIPRSGESYEEQTRALRKSLARLPNLKVLAIDAEWQELLIDLPVEKQPKCLKDLNFATSSDRLVKAGIRNFWRLTLEDDAKSVSKCMVRRLKQKQPWQVGILDIELSFREADSISRHEILVETVWKDFGVDSVETLEVFSKRPWRAQLLWVFVMLFVSTETHGCNVLGTISLGPFVDGIFLALLMKQAVGEDGFWRRHRRLRIRLEEMEDVQVPKELVEWVQVTDQRG